MSDIYNRLPSDQSYKLLCETDDGMENIISQIKMILGTKRGDVLGEPYFGLDLNRYIFSMDYNQDEINQIVQDAIIPNLLYDSSKYNVKLSVSFGKDHVNHSDYAVIDIIINQMRCMGIVMN